MDKYRVIEGKIMTKVIFDGCTYSINNISGSLSSLETSIKKSRDIVIPHILPSGHQIAFLGANFLQGKFGKITISNGIKVNRSAFAYSDVEEVVWPEDYEEIPPSCFADSTIERISNIDKVKIIYDSAFAGSNLKEIVWPSCCKRIPYRCFASSKLHKIDNLSHIEEIGLFAFNKSGIVSIDLSDTNVTLLAPGSLTGLSFRQSVPPYYLSNDDWEKAFSMREI